jgi:hypothetical protein
MHIRRNKMKSKYLKGYRLVIDGFMDNGEGALWSLMHPIKSNATTMYMINILDFDPILKEDKDLINELERLAKIDGMWFDIYITCNIGYVPLEFDGEIEPLYNIVKSMQILKIEIENGKEPGQP